MRPTRRTILAAASGFALAILPALGAAEMWSFWVVS
jgi:hypothetical protein